MSTYNRKGLAHSRKVITKSSLGATTRHQSHRVQSSLYREILEFNRERFNENLFSNNHFVSSSSVLTIRDKNSNDLGNLFNRELKINNHFRNDTEFDDDVPLIFTGISKPSSKIDKMISKRKNDHEEALVKMNKELSLVQSNFDDEFFNRSKSVKIEINDLRLRIKKVREEFEGFCVKTSYDSILNKDLKILNFDKVNDIIDDEKKLINNFYKNLLIIENKRRDNVIPIFKYYYKYFHNISHILPYEIQIYFENQILNYNEIILANHRIYADLRLKMLLTADNEKIGFKYWIDNFMNK